MKQSYTLYGTPLNYIYLPHISQRSRHEQQLRLNIIRNELQLQHTDCPPFTGPLSLEVLFYLDAKSKQKHSHYLPSGYTIYNLIRFIQKVSEGIIYTHNANISSYNSLICYDAEPKTIITILNLTDNTRKGSYGKD